MNDNVCNTRFAFNILLCKTLNQSLNQIPDTAPYKVSHFFTNYPTALHASMCDGRVMNLTYVIHPDVDHDCFKVNVYFESINTLEPIITVIMDIPMLNAYQEYVNEAIAVSVYKQGFDNPK